MDGNTLLTFHQRALDAARSAIAGMSTRDVRRPAPDSKKTCAGEIVHICQAEGYWLLKIDLPAPKALPGDAPTVEELIEGLSALHVHMNGLMERHSSFPDLRGVLMHVSLHALYHLPILIRIRQTLDPEWTPPRWDSPGSFEQAVGPLVRYALEHME